MNTNLLNKIGIQNKDKDLYNTTLLYNNAKTIPNALDVPKIIILNI